MTNGKETKRNGKSLEWVYLLVFFILSAVCTVLGILCLERWSSSVVERNFILFSSLLGIFFCIAYGLGVWFVLSGKNKLTKTLLSGYIFISFCLILIFILQRTGFFEVVQSSEKLKEYLERAGVWMPLLYIALQYLQVVILPIPGIVSTVAGVALFGAFWTMIYSLIGIILGSVTAFFIGRKLGHKAVAWMVGEEDLDKWQKKLKGKDNLFLTVMFLLPLFPDDVLCFIAGLSSMTTRYFLIMIVVSRVLAIAGTCYSIDFIPFNTWWGITIWLVFFAVIVVAFFLIYKNMDKIQNTLKRWRKKRKEKKTRS